MMGPYRGEETSLYSLERSFVQTERGETETDTHRENLNLERMVAGRRDKPSETLSRIISPKESPDQRSRQRKDLTL